MVYSSASASDSDRAIREWVFCHRLRSLRFITPTTIPSIVKTNQWVSFDTHLLLLQEMIDEADRDGDGEINEAEFLRIMKKTSLY